MWQLATTSLDVNSPYSYLMLAEHFGSTCAVAMDGDDLAGFVTGFRLPADPSVLFIWQIAVAASHRGEGVASQLLDHVADRAITPRLRWLEATVTPSNDASTRTFQRFARRRLADCEMMPLFDRDHFPGRDHEPEVQIRIGPF